MPMASAVPAAPLAGTVCHLVVADDATARQKRRGDVGRKHVLFSAQDAGRGTGVLRLGPRGGVGVAGGHGLEDGPRASASERPSSMADVATSDTPGHRDM